MGNFKVYTLLILTKLWVKLLLLYENALKLHHIEKARISLLVAIKKFQTHTHKPVEAEPSFGKVCLPPAKLRMLFIPLVRGFGHKSTPSDRPWIETYCP